MISLVTTTIEFRQLIPSGLEQNQLVAGADSYSLEGEPFMLNASLDECRARIEAGSVIERALNSQKESALIYAHLPMARKSPEQPLRSNADTQSIVPDDEPDD